MMLTQDCMRDLAKQEQEEGRLPKDIKIEHAKLPDDLKDALEKAREEASKARRNRSDRKT